MEPTLTSLRRNPPCGTESRVPSLGRTSGRHDQGLGHEETKAALDGLLDADLVVWEAGGTDHLWRISPRGRDLLSRARG
jgi:ketosteroid isomerase-like protein